ncbi:MAG: response regulator [Lachnospiraceae bacterium]|nr:response regulator [Lachnospiraceae bacterium]
MSGVKEDLKQYLTDFGELDVTFRKKFRETIDSHRWKSMNGVSIEVVAIGIMAIVIMILYHSGETANAFFLQLRFFSVIAFIATSLIASCVYLRINKYNPHNLRLKRIVMNTAWCLWCIESLLCCFSFAAVMKDDQLEYAITMTLFVMTLSFYSLMRAYIFLPIITAYCGVFVVYAVIFEAPATMYVYILVMYILALLVAATRYIPLQNIFAESQQVERTNERLQDLVQEAVKKANEASSARGDFFARASHDMRTPMNGILGLIHLTLQEEGLTPVVKENLSKMDITGRYLLNLINDLLDLQKIEDGKITFKAEPVGWLDFIESMLVVFEPAINEKELNFKVEKINLTDCSVNIDSLRVQQIFTNIISNAIKFTNPGGNIRCIIEETEKSENSIHLRFTVSDNGIGMTEEFQKHIFEPFTQEDNGISFGNGTGLGMAIVKKVVEMLGGNISIESVRGKGTKVTVELQLERCGAVVAKKIETNDDMSALVGKRVLLCEDNPLNMEIAVKLLETKGMIVEKAENGKIGVEKFQKSAPGYYSVVLMDIRMPIMNGYDATKAIRSLRRSDAGTVPIIAMSANAFREDIDESLRSGMNEHIIKPIVVKTLYSTILKFI